MDSPTPSSLVSSTPQDTEIVGYPDYSVWTEERWAAYPGLANYHNPTKERKWWWRYGFRLRDCSRPKNQDQIWVCESCFLAKKPAKDTKFVATTSGSIENHLKDSHGVIDPKVCDKIDEGS